MKLTLEQNPDLNLITGYGADHLMINKVRHDGNLIVGARQIVPGWATAGFDGLTAEDFSKILDLAPEIVMIGTGARLRFPPHALLRPLIEARVGFEVMDLGAACRTYNVLVNEGRAVVAALLLDPE
ncbi:MAG: Mth938-like domain-containing protein [Rhodocyclaceae bacterium]|jgi:uncharacterized protein|nr:Mth938-like domain-containing protein [Rhodocyclaceae bacterium]MCL4758328.1 Mth938-like domain-containing protein [Rhodocyclaceae bacterium]